MANPYPEREQRRPKKDLNPMTGERLSEVGIGVGVLGFLFWFGILYFTGCFNPNGCYPAEAYIRNGTIDLIPSVCLVLLFASLFEWRHYRSLRVPRMDSENKSEGVP